MLRSYRDLLVWQKAILETQTILSQRLDYATAAQADRILSESEVVGKMLGSLIRSLRPKTA